jgi:peptidoglycan hydrolase CwlO-like protein
MGEASAVDLVPQPAIECQVPQWLYNAYNHLEENINHFHELVNELESKGRRLEDAFPQLASLYTGLLNDQNTLYALASSNAESLQNA